MAPGGPLARKTTPILTVALLSLLATGPMHGYELKKRVGMALGRFTGVSEGSLYPLLHDLEESGLIVGHTEQPHGGKRDRVVYAITGPGLEGLRTRLAAPLDPGPGNAADFYVRVVGFGYLAPERRAQLIAERRVRLEAERDAHAALQETLAGAPGHAELGDLRLRQVLAELEWLDGLARNARETNNRH